MDALKEIDMDITQGLIEVLQTLNAKVCECETLENKKIIAQSVTDVVFFLSMLPSTMPLPTSLLVDEGDGKILLCWDLRVTLYFTGNGNYTYDILHKETWVEMEKEISVIFDELPQEIRKTLYDTPGGF